MTLETGGGTNRRGLVPEGGAMVRGVGVTSGPKRSQILFVNVISEAEPANFRPH